MKERERERWGEGKKRKIVNCPFLSYPAVRRRRRHGYHHRASYGLGGGVSSLHPRRGIVHFSNVIELRAAATEMNDYRMITTVSRTTGFGQTQSIHYLKYAFEPMVTGNFFGEVLDLANWRVGKKLPSANAFQ